LRKERQVEVALNHSK